MGHLLPIECERARSAMSARLDAELSSFEETLVAAHVRHCMKCRSFEQQVAGITTAVRQAPLEPLSLPVALPAARTARWQPARRLAGAGAVAAVVLLAVVGFATALDRSASNGDGVLASAFDRRSATNEPLVDLIRPTLGTIAYGAGGIGVYKPPIV